LKCLVDNRLLDRSINRTGFELRSAIVVTRDRPATGFDVGFDLRSGSIGCTDLTLLSLDAFTFLSFGLPVRFGRLALLFATKKPLIVVLIACAVIELPQAVFLRLGIARRSRERLCYRNIHNGPRVRENRQLQGDWSPCQLAMRHGGELRNKA